MNKTVKHFFIISIFLLVGIIFFNTKPVFGAIYYAYTYNISNKNSGKYLNVNYGTDANGTNVTQYTNDGSKEQKFSIKYDDFYGAYRIYAMCSSEGDGRVLDVLRTGGSASGSIVSGNNVDIWAANDNAAQLWQINDRGNGYYSIQLSSNQNLALTAVGTGNGSGAGTGSTSNGNIIVQTYTGANNQLWKLTDTPVLWEYDLVDSSKHLDYTTSTKYQRQFADAVNTWNAYKSGVIRGPYSATSAVIDVTVSDYYDSNTNQAGVTSAITNTIRFNTYLLDSYNDSKKLNVCIHELGHALGLGHRQEPNSVMYPVATNCTALNTMDKWNYDRSYSRF